MNLLGRAFSPLTDSILFARGHIDTVIEAVRKSVPTAETATARPLTVADLEDAIVSLDPMNVVVPSSFLIAGTEGSWTAVFSNATEPSVTQVAPIAVGTRSEAVYFHHSPDLSASGGQFGSTVFAAGGPEVGSATTKWPTRLVFVGHDGDRWAFGEDGPPEPYENVSQYRARRVRDRLDEGQLVAYAEACGIRLEDANFYRGPFVLVRVGNRLTRIVDRILPAHTLAKERRNRGIT